MTDTVTILKAARDLIAKPENWTQGSYYEVKRGNHCYCALGAIAHVQGVTPTDDVEGSCWLALEVTDGESIIGSHVANFNDTHTHAEVLSLFSKAITAAEEAGR
jgi:hypothetical protein